MDVDFYTLERPVQDRFSDATRSIGVPTPIVREPPVDRRASYWLVAAAFILAGFVGWVLRGFGNLESATAIVPLPFAAGYVGLAGVVAFCVLRAAALRSARGTLPYQPGLYLFPAGIFDARSDRLRVFRHSDLKGAALDGRAIRVRAEGEEFVLRLPSSESAEVAFGAFETGRDQFEQANRSANRREQAILDPLVDSGFSSPFSPQLPLVRCEPLWAKLAIGLALALGGLSGAAVWKARNVLSERRLYAAATARDTASAYRAYLGRGGARLDVSEVRLPRAELRTALAEGTAEALEHFRATHPGSKIQAEIDAALQAVIVKELAAATEAGTVTALRAFKEKRATYPFVAAPVEAATVAIYKRLLREFSAGRDPVAVSFFERLLGYSKVHGPKVTVQIVRRLPESVEAADGQVKRSAYFMGKQSIPSQYFTGDYAERREKAAFDRIAAVIAQPFPVDVISVEAAPTISDPGAVPVPVPSAPTLLIEYAPEMAGGYMSPKPRGVFVGVGMTFKATFSIPGDSQPLEYKSSQWRAPNPLILQREGTTVADVYERMAADGFDKFTKGFLVLLSGKP